MSTSKALQFSNVINQWYPFYHVDIEDDTIWLRKRLPYKKNILGYCIFYIFLLGIASFIWLPDLIPLSSSLRYSLTSWWHQFLLKIYVPPNMIADTNKFLKWMFTGVFVFIGIAGLIEIITLYSHSLPLVSIDENKEIINIYKPKLYHTSKIISVSFEEFWCLFIVWEPELDFSSDNCYLYLIHKNGTKYLIDMNINQMGIQFAFLSFLLDKPIFVTYLNAFWNKKFPKKFEDIPSLMTEDFLNNHCDVLVFKDIKDVIKWLKTNCTASRV